MDCKKCGTPLEENDQFCKNCGAPVNQVSAQTNYGPAPKNGTLKFVLIFLGIAIIVAAIIIAVAVFAGDKDKDDDDDDVRTSKKKTEIVTKDDEDEDEDEDEDIKVKDEDEEEEDDEVVVKPTTKSTYTVKFDGFTFKIPTDLVYETMSEDGTNAILIGDEDATWMASMGVIQGSYNQMSSNINQLQPLYQQEGCNASAAVEKTIAGLPVITMEISEGGANAIVAWAKANSMYVFGLTVYTLDNDFDYELVEKVAEILSTAEYTGETANMNASQGIDFSLADDLAKE